MPLIRRCCICHRTFGTVPNAVTHGFTDGICEVCFPSYWRENLGSAVPPYPGEMREAFADSTCRECATRVPRSAYFCSDLHAAAFMERRIRSYGIPLDVEAETLAVHVLMTADAFGE